MCVNGESMNNSSSEIEMRPMFCELNALTRADGSAVLTQGETAVMASVYGPIECKLQNVQIEKAHIEVYYRSKCGMPSVSDRLREQIIKNTSEEALLTVLHPRTAITIQLQEMDDRGGLIACSINASCLALLNSGFPMKFLVGAVHCVIDQNDELILDPDRKQIIGSKAQLTFVFDSVQKNVVSVHTAGKYSIVQYNDAMILCQGASDLVFQFYKEAVAKFAKVL